MSKPAVGIDLGTTYSAVAVYRNGNVEIISNDQGNRTTPSCVAFTSVQRIVGEGAIYQAAQNPENTVYGVKRLMGRSIDDEVIQRDIEVWPFSVMEEDGFLKIDVCYQDERKRFFPEEISAAILDKMKKTAEDFLCTEVKDVVITCPAYFNNAQRQATKDAAQVAGLNVLRMINEPTAAAMAYGLSVNNVGRKNVLIFDFGGGTFDVSILTIKDKDYKVRATNGDTHLGGEDFDQRMVDFFVDEFKRKHDRDISGDRGLMRNLKIHCERVKKMLSGTTKAEFTLEGTNLTGIMSRPRFEDLNYELFERAIDIVDATLRDAEMTKSEIDEVVLVGGSSRIPKIQEMLSEFFDGKNLNQTVNPDEAVAMGAAIQAALLQDEVSNRLKGLKLCDVCPLSLGSKILDGSVEVIIKRNTPIPTKASTKFYNAYDNQRSMNVEIYEGERLLARDNHFLGRFMLSGIPPMPRGEAQVEDTYEIDANGILTVTATVLASGRNQSLTITNTSRINEHDAKRLACDAEKFRQEDAMHKDRLLALNSFEACLYEMKRKVSQLESADKQDQALKALESFTKWFDQNQEASKQEFEAKKCELDEFWNQLMC